jgi:hypothetical protein
LDAEIFGVEVGNDAVALEGVGFETLQQEFATVDGNIFIPIRSTAPAGF